MQKDLTLNLIYHDREYNFIHLVESGLHSCLCLYWIWYSAVHGFWLVEELAELADGPTGCGEVARGGCLFASNVSVSR
jgi:hypothetical protein